MIFWQIVTGQTSKDEETNIHEVELPHKPVPARRSIPPHVRNRKYLNYLFITDEGEPKRYDEAC